jgi:hypothetical protein
MSIIANVTARNTTVSATMLFHLLSYVAYFAMQDSIKTLKSKGLGIRLVQCQDGFGRGIWNEVDA